MTTILFELPNGRVDSIKIDAVLSREQAKSIEVTKFPVEDGSVISDHAIGTPDTYRLDGVISGMPIGYARRDKDGNLPAKSREEDPGRVSLARAKLEELFERKGVVTIDAGRVLENMIMTSLRFPEDGSTGKSVRFSATFERISTASVETVAAPVVKKKTSGGQKPTEKATEPVAKKASVLKQLVDMIRKG